MDAEILFFMTPKDQADFLAFAKNQLDGVDASDTILHLTVGDCSLHFTPSFMEDDVIYMGKLEIRLGKVDCNDKERLKATFRKLRNWIKKHYFSRLAYLDKKKKDKLTPSRVHWLGADAKQWKQSEPSKHFLRLSKTSWMIFEIGI